MTDLGSYDVSADLLSVLRAHRAGQRLAARLVLVGPPTTPAATPAPGSRASLSLVPCPGQSRHRPVFGPGDASQATAVPPDGGPATDPAAWLDVLDGMVHSGLKARFLGGGGVFTTVDPDGLTRALEESRRFRRDTATGGFFHRRKVSFREVAPFDSLHVVIDGTRVSSHIDRVSPLNCDPYQAAHYSPGRVLVHSVTAFADDVRLRLPSRARTAWSPPPEPANPDRSGGPETITTVAFNVIDDAIHLLDTEAAPWSIQLELRLDGPLDDARLRSAVQAALGRHPMARARKKASQRTLHGDSWEIPTTVDVDPLRIVECPDDESLERARTELQSLAVPLAESPPLRLRLARHHGGDVLMLNVNHAAMDGFGALRVLRSVARAYAGVADPVAEADFSHSRDLPRRLAAPNLPTRLRRQLVLVEKLRDLVMPPARLAGDGASGETGYGFHLSTLPAADTKALLDLHHPGTVNDVLLAALHRAIAGWNSERHARCGRIGVLVPANLRPPEWRNEMVGNFSLPARVTTTRRSRRGLQSTLQAVTAQTARKKKTGMGTALIELLGRSNLLPLWAKQAMVMTLPLTGNRLVDTAMLSNLGSLDDVPTFGAEAAAVTEVWFSPPARMPLGLSIGVVTMSGRLHLSFRYRRRLLGPDAARRFADRYLDELRRFTAAI